MRLACTFALTLALVASAGCSTTQQVTLAKSTVAKQISSVAQVSADGNSVQMDTNLEAAVTKNGLSLKAKLPAGTGKSKDADALISYVDVWRWDIVMYMKNLTVKLHDAESGDLLAIGEWSDSALHGFRDARLVMEGLVAEVLAKVKASTKSNQ